MSSRQSVLHGEPTLQVVGRQKKKQGRNSARRTKPTTTGPDNQARQRNQTTGQSAKGAQKHNTPGNKRPHTESRQTRDTGNFPAFEKQHRSRTTALLCVFAILPLVLHPEAQYFTALLSERTHHILSESGALDINRDVVPTSSICRPGTRTKGGHYVRTMV